MSFVANNFNCFNFLQLSYKHQKEFIRWIEGAKRDQTRQNRIAQTIQMLKDEIQKHG
ncbi:MAG: YdeI/OmpD-associated family protein [Flexilinea sp.]